MNSTRLTATNIEVQHRGAVAEICLQRPAVRNALDTATIHDLIAALADITASDARAIVVRGAGTDFCAGADLHDMQQSASWTSAQNLEQARTLADLFAKLDAMPQVVVAAVQGAALGGGAGLLACCDVVVASSHARLGFVEARLGLAPAVIAPYVLRRVGVARTRRLFVTGQILDASAACQMGLVDEVVCAADAQGLAQAVQRWLELVLANGPQAVATIKLLVRRLSWSLMPAAEAAEVGATTLAQLRQGSEAQEGLAAFLGKRPPAWHVKL